MKHLKMVSRKPQVMKAQTVLQQKLDFALYVFDSVTEYVMTKQWSL